MGMMSPTEPIQADHRFIWKVLDTTAAGKVVYIPKEFSRVSKIFVQSGGSWEKVFLGSIRHVMQLKKVIKVGIKTGYLTHKGSW
jgi:hypothetical protein